MYFNGRGVSKDYVLAHVWFSIAAANEQPSVFFPDMNRNIVAALMTPDQLAEAQRIAREWTPSAER